MDIAKLIACVLLFFTGVLFSLLLSNAKNRGHSIDAFNIGVCVILTINLILYLSDFATL